MIFGVCLVSKSKRCKPIISQKVGKPEKLYSIHLLLVFKADLNKITCTFAFIVSLHKGDWLYVATLEAAERRKKSAVQTCGFVRTNAQWGCQQRHLTTRSLWFYIAHAWAFSCLSGFPACSKTQRFG